MDVDMLGGDKIKGSESERSHGTTDCPIIQGFIQASDIEYPKLARSHWGKCPPAADILGTVKGTDARAWSQHKEDLTLRQPDLVPSAPGHAPVNILQVVTSTTRAVHSQLVKLVKKDVKVSWAVVVGNTNKHLVANLPFDGLSRIAAAPDRETFNSPSFDELIPMALGDYGVFKQRFQVISALREASLQQETLVIPKVSFFDPGGNHMALCTLSLLDADALMKRRVEYFEPEHSTISVSVPRCVSVQCVPTVRH